MMMLIMMMYACFQHVDIAALLIRYHTDVNATDRWLFTPIHEAAQKGRTQLCALLVGAFTCLFVYYVIVKVDFYLKFRHPFSFDKLCQCFQALYVLGIINVMYMFPLIPQIMYNSSPSPISECKL